MYIRCNFRGKKTQLKSMVRKEQILTEYPTEDELFPSAKKFHFGIAL